jgi:hypothetical protein
MRGSFAAVAAVFALASCPAFAQQQPPIPNNASSPACQRLIGQLTALDRGNADPYRADQIRRAEDAVNRQQYQVDRLVSQSRRLGCESTGLFSIFSNPPRECSGLNRQIDQQRNALDRLQNQLERLNGGTAERAAQRESLLIALGNNACGPQYRSAAAAGQRGGFFDRLFGGTDSGQVIPEVPAGPMGNTFRTLCVRLGDGYYYPISYSTTSDHFQRDAEVCRRSCPAADVQLFVYHNPGEDVAQAVSLTGTRYADLPAAFSYRKKLSNYSCRPPGESWYEALKTSGPDQTVQPGDLIVTEKNAKQLAQPGQNAAASKKSKATDPAELRGSESALADAPGKVDPNAKHKVRSVGPTFLPSH